jgi:shikimate kinase
MMGSGKSTIGRLLAEATGWPRYDNDQLLAELYGKSAREIVETSGEQAKRDAEDAALAHGLSNEAPFVLDAAGGTIDSEVSREALAGAIVVWLRAAPETLYRRALGAEHRPFLENGEEWFATTSARREPLYESVADIVLDTDGRNPQEIATEALLRLGELCQEVRSK